MNKFDKVKKAPGRIKRIRTKLREILAEEGVRHWSPSEVEHELEEIDDLLFNLQKYLEQG